MKINRIKALCKAAHKCVIYSEGDRQYIGTTAAIYPADGLMLTPASVATLFDMPDAADVMRLEEKTIEQCDIAPVTACNVSTLREGGFISWLGEPLQALVDDVSGAVLWVHDSYIRAAEYTEEYRTYRLGENEKGEPLVLIKDGFLTIGIVKPIPKRTAKSISMALEGLSQLVPIGSPNPGDAESRKQESDHLEGQIGMEVMDDEPEEG